MRAAGALEVYWSLVPVAERVCFVARNIGAFFLQPLHLLGSVLGPAHISNSLLSGPVVAVSQATHESRCCDGKLSQFLARH